MGEKCNHRQIGEKMGVSRQRITKMVKNGQIQPDPDGKIDADHVKEVWAALDPSKKQGQQTTAAGGGNRIGRPRKDGEAKLHVVDGGGALTKARTAREIANARIADLKSKQLSGELVSRSAVQHEAHSIGRTLVQRLLALPHRAAPMVAPMTEIVDVRGHLEKEIKEIVGQLQEDIAKAANNAY